ncbi:LysR substrate-binding domain-containing protein [Streptomyces sp. H27-D2]|uniref:LysR substrate-binding domain-containing protein n=1 Tax=Streptomyces sp. H27-D2 TaxID=3046304 RepID=UPI002DBF5C9B|nr:LysR substrate-binding domain-containing protein [Streptomyces sp. H27-D2]MEC4018718.1 LysR substrate-binding domain-containing protein [Streptomyces sp. H27-D2]
MSQQVRKLEAAAGRQLFTRDTHSVELTEDGEAMLGFARSILEANERAAGWFAGTRLRGRLRFGASEDFVLTRLPEILEGFRSDHPEVDLELTVDLSGTLHERLAAGRLDLVLAKRRAQDTHGRLVWRGKLVWIGGERLRIDPERPLPLILFPPPGITRARALEVLEAHGRAWRITCTSGSLSGLVAAARAGLGVMAHTRGMIPPGLVRVPDRVGLPELGPVDFVLLHGGAGGTGGARGGGGARGTGETRGSGGRDGGESGGNGGRPAGSPADALAAAILAGGDRLHRPVVNRP